MTPNFIYYLTLLDSPICQTPITATSGSFADHDQQTVSRNSTSLPNLNSTYRTQHVNLSAESFPALQSVHSPNLSDNQSNGRHWSNDNNSLNSQDDQITPNSSQQSHSSSFWNSLQTGASHVMNSLSSWASNVTGSHSNISNNINNSNTNNYSSNDSH